VSSDVMTDVRSSGLGCYYWPILWTWMPLVADFMDLDAIISQLFMDLDAISGRFYGLGCYY